jgi:hypothetical protein
MVCDVDPKGLIARRGYTTAGMRWQASFRHSVEVAAQCEQLLCHGMCPMRTEMTKLDPSRQSYESQRFESELNRRIVKQQEGVRALVDLYQVFCAGMGSEGRPVGNVLFLGPTGSGKHGSWKPQRRSFLEIRRR